MAFNPNERRQHPRFTIAVMVRIEYTSFKFQANTENLSLGGMFLLTPRRLPISTRVKLEITPSVQGLPPVRVEGVVVRIRDSEPRGLAICFTDFSEKEKGRLAVLLEKLSQPGDVGTDGT
jgi:c-di-GMP-binding flagellar brake protein YcgR